MVSVDATQATKDDNTPHHHSHVDGLFVKVPSGPVTRMQVKCHPHNHRQFIPLGKCPQYHEHPSG